MPRLNSIFSFAPLPAFARVKQRFDDTRIHDVRREIRERLLAAGLRQRVGPGSRIAITAGSRGGSWLTELLNGIADAVKTCGGQPFIIPAMGSHGSATAEGQAHLLNKLGVDDRSVAAPIRATMETISLGESKNGAVAHLDKIAAEADGIIVLGRVKSHPERSEGIASGLLKMTTVGLGKQVGARQAHSHGLWKSVEAVPEVTLAKSKVLFGVAVVENALRQPAIVEVIPGNYAAFIEADRRLLKQAKPFFATVPFDDLDVLVVDELGKDIAGTGMDLNVIGKWRLEGGEHKPDFRRIVVRAITPGSCGNGLGIGLADFTTEKFVRDFDPEPTSINLVTATEPDADNTREGALPVVLPNDREAIQVAVQSAMAKNGPRICRIKSTAMLDELWVSEALLKEVRSMNNLTLLSEPTPLDFDSDGNLIAA